MVSIKIIILAFFFMIVVSFYPAESIRLRRITRPVEKVVKEVGRVGEQVVDEVGRGVERVGKELGRGFDHSRRLVSNLVKKPLSGLRRLRLPNLKLLGSRRHGHAEVGSEEPVVETHDNEAFDVKLLRLHNELRTLAGSESALSWDPLLVTMAQEWANQCSIGYKIFDDSRDDTYGQNIYPVKEGEAHPYNAVQMWKSFQESYAPGTFECRENQDCYPYLQMIWPTSTYLGCAVTQCPLIQDIGTSGAVLVCFYTPI